MQILVTGGAGFIGQAVTAALVATAHRVVVLDSLRDDVHRDAGKAARSRLAALGADLIVGDVQHGSVVATALRGIDAVVHLGEHGQACPGARTREALSHSHFEPSCPRCGADLAPGMVDESAPMDPRNTYAATKVTQEHLGWIWARESGGSAISLRLHNVYRPGMPRDTPYAGVASIFSSDRGLQTGETSVTSPPRATGSGTSSVGVQRFP
ncbi:MAG: dTDP-L-rhamnose 4-epimerase [Actinomycetota bacterium]|jgi:dTDP-L-rhamnose 4-epimerase|nr:dTDP-L-rhamnose 4-epimerase [Actinomycetota bacterium]